MDAFLDQFLEFLRCLSLLHNGGQILVAKLTLAMVVLFVQDRSQQFSWLLAVPDCTESIIQSQRFVPILVLHNLH